MAKSSRLGDLLDTGSDPRRTAPVMGYVRQANIANGLRQVNNTSATSATPDSIPHAGENQTPQNRLLEEKYVKLRRRREQLDRQVSPMLW